MHVLIYKQLKRAGMSANRIIKHIWESKVQWHVASSPRNVRNAEPARMPRECLPTPQNVVPWNATTIQQSGMEQREEGIGPILTIARTQPLHHFSLHPLTPIVHREDPPVQHNFHLTKKVQAVNFLLCQSSSSQKNVDTTISFHNCHSTHSGQAHARPSLEKLLHLAFAADITSLFPFQYSIWVNDIW